MKILHIVSEVEKSHHLEWLTLEIKDHYDLRVILLGNENTAHQRFLQGLNIPVFVVKYNSRLSYFKAAIAVMKIIKNESPMVVHTHFWGANIIGIPAAFLTRVPVRVMTRHHGNLHHQFYKKGVVIDKILNKMSTLILAPTVAIRNLLVNSEGANPEKVEVANHGIDLCYYESATELSISNLRQKHGIPSNKKIIGVISRHIEWKGIQYIIPAFKQVLAKISSAHLVLANANGDYKQTINGLLKSLPSDSYSIIEYENDAAALYASFDIFVHTPVDLYGESFGLIYIEALAAGKPSVFTLSGVAPEFIRDGFNAIVVDYKNEDQIFSGVMAILSNQSLATNLVMNGRNSVVKFSARQMGMLTRRAYDKFISRILNKK